MSDILTCKICMAPLNDDIETANPTSLECGHVFHTYCITTYCQIANQTVNEMPCPTCKQTGIEISELRSQAQRDMLIPGKPLETQQPPRTPPPPGTEVDALANVGPPLDAPKCATFCSATVSSDATSTSFTGHRSHGLRSGVSSGRTD